MPTAWPSVMAVVTENVEGATPRGSAETRAMLVELVRDLAPRIQPDLGVSTDPTLREVAGGHYGLADAPGEN